MAANTRNAGQSQPLTFKVTQSTPNEGCEDFSAEPLGRRYSDYTQTYLPSGLNIYPRPEQGAPIDATIVAFGAGHALSYQQAAQDNLNWNSITFGIENIESPLIKPLTVTVEFEVINATFTRLNVNYGWFGVDPIGLLVNNTARSFNVTYPAGARPDSGYGGRGFTFRILRDPYVHIKTSGTVRIKSICWK